MKRRIMKLGKAIVNELNLDPGVDTLSRWMAHYIAEQIEVAEQEVGLSKEEAEKKCFDTILKLWAHRSSMPNGKRPFENFEPIFNILKKIDPENKQPFYFYNNQRGLELEEISLNKNDLNHYLHLAEGIDKVVRIWIEYILKQATLCVKDDDAKKWLENSIGLRNKDESSVISYLIYDDLWGEGKNKKERKQDFLNFRIKQLEAFNEFNRGILNLYRKELEDLT